MGLIGKAARGSGGGTNTSTPDSALFGGAENGVDSGSKSSAASVGVHQNRVLTSAYSDVGSLADSDFVQLEEPRKQANTLVFGDGGTGKTTLATLFAPEPVAFINFDRRASHAVRAAMARGRHIHYAQIDFPANITKLDDVTARKFGQTAVDKVIRNYEIAIRESQKGNIRTICLDTCTEYAEILKIAITGRIDKGKGDFGKSKDLINRELWKLYNLAREGNAHLIMLARGKAVWENNEPTGKFTYRGPDVMNDAADWSAHIRLKKARGGRSKKSFEMEITKAGVTIEELGAVYSDSDWADLDGPFVYACVLQYPGTLPEDWQ